VPPAKKKRRTYALVSLGCPKNLVDSERMAGLLERNGYRMVADADGADVAIVNTCGFIGDARTESYAVIEEMLRLKKRKRLGRLIVAGCLAEREKESLLEKYPGIDRLVGVFARDEIVEIVNLGNKEKDSQRSWFPPSANPPLPDADRHRLTLPHLAYLKIAEGCNRLCSFCSIPLIRGPYAGKPIERVVAEAEQLAADGVRELIVVAQDTTFYGLDTDGRPRLAELLRRLEAIEGLAWIRLMYLYPMHITDELIETIAGGKKILPYLDIPLQHIDDEVLRRMRRRVSRDETERLLDHLRERIEGLVLRTTLLTGFPGETDEQFETLLDFVRRRKFERLGVFAFSEEPGTAAFSLDGQLPDKVKQARRDRLMAAQLEIAFAWNASQVGRRWNVLIDRCISKADNAYLGRSYADAPEVDCGVYVTGENLAPGRIVPCEIVAAEGYDLVAVSLE
jgi:ribosomal protein S12 methylthiotransferase